MTSKPTTEKRTSKKCLTGARPVPYTSRMDTTTTTNQLATAKEATMTNTDKITAALNNAGYTTATPHDRVIVVSTPGVIPSTYDVTQIAVAATRSNPCRIQARQGGGTRTDLINVIVG